MTPWLTFRQAAEQYPLTEANLRSLAAAGDIDARNVAPDKGTRWAVSTDSINDWIQSRPKASDPK